MIDALVVSLSLDAAGFMKSQAAARAAVKGMSSEERAAAKDAEEFTKRRSEGYRKLAGTVLGLYAVFTGGQSIAQFTRSITESDAATGRLAKNLNMSANSLASWEDAAKQTGGSAGGVDGSFRSLSNSLQQFAMTGESSVIPYFRQLGIALSDSHGKMRPLDDLMLDISSKLQGMDPARAQAFGANFGFDEGTINLLMQGPGAVRAMIAQQKALGEVTDEQSKRAQALQKSWDNLDHRFHTFGRNVVEGVTPALQHLFDTFGDFLDRHPEIQKAIIDTITSISTYLANIKYEDVVAGFNRIKAALKEWLPIAEAFFALWAVGRVAGMVQSIMTIAGAFGSVTTAMLGMNAARAAGAAGGAATAGGTAVAGGAAAGGLLGWLTALLPLSFLAAVGPIGGEDADFSKRKNDEWLKDHPRVDPGTDSIQPGPHVDVGGNDDGKVKPGAPVSTFGSHGMFGPILSLLGMSEGTDKGRGYNETLGYGKYTGDAVNLTDMTLDQVGDLQKKMLANGASSTAVGRYQFITKTLKDLTGQLGLDPSKTKFTPEIQDKLAERDIQNRGGNKFLSGALSLKDFMLNLAKEWASIADPRTGHSYYGQGVGSTIEQTTRALNQLVPTAGQRWASDYSKKTTTSTSSHETNINGPINIHTAATDANGIAKGIGDAVRKHSFVSQANYGLA